MRVQRRELARQRAQGVVDDRPDRPQRYWPGIAPRTASPRLALAWIGSALLGGCQSLQPSAPADVQLDGWRVVEASATRATLAPDAGGWVRARPEAAPAGRQRPPGAGGRVIPRAAATTSAPARPAGSPCRPSGPREHGAAEAGLRLPGRVETAPKRLGSRHALLAIEVRGTVFEVGQSRPRPR